MGDGFLETGETGEGCGGGGFGTSFGKIGRNIAFPNL